MELITHENLTRRKFCNTSSPDYDITRHSLLLSLGYCQKKKLPSGNFKFVDKPEEVARDIIANYKPEDNTGYIMKVDLVS